MWPTTNLNEVFKSIYLYHASQVVEYTFTRETTQLYDSALDINVEYYNRQFLTYGKYLIA